MQPIQLSPVTEISRPFWEGLAAQRVRLQRCGECSRWVFFPRGHCPHCASASLAWHEVSGRGRLVSATLARVPPLPEFAAGGPLLIAVVELDEGVHLNTNLVEVDPDDVEVGMAVEPVFVPAVDAAGAPAMRLCFRRAARTA